MRNLKLTLEYDGTDFHGFQRQSASSGLRTVQATLEDRFSRLLDEDTKLIGAGRTDAGVHALGQVANFHTARPIPTPALPQVLNAALPPDVKVQRCEEVDERFHARRCARARTYRYTIIERQSPSPIRGRFALLLPQHLDLPRMQAAAEPLLGPHDFRAFQAGGSQTRTTHRTLLRLECLRHEDTIHIIAQADSFLYRMVRLIVGALLDVGRGALPPQALAAALASRSPLNSPPAKPCGLCLIQVSYDLASASGGCPRRASNAHRPSALIRIA